MLNATEPQKISQLGLLAGVSLLSLVLLTGTDQVVSMLLPASLKVIAYIRIPSLLFCFLLWFALGRHHALYFPVQLVQWRGVLLPAAMWIVPTIVLTLGHIVWLPQIVEPVDIIAFMLTGLLAEEFLFRGAIYDLVFNVSAHKVGAKLAIGYSALFFGLSHFQYHHFAFTQAALTQVMYTIVLGVLLGMIRNRSGSIWPCVLVHMVGNSFTLIANLM